MRMLLSYNLSCNSLDASRTALVGCALVLALSLSACANKNPLMEPAGNAATGVQTTSLHGKDRVLWVLSPYRMDIQQGNFISQEMASQLKEGMTRDQVRFLLGTPLLSDVFHANRWDYAFSMTKGNGDHITSRVSVFFKENRLERFEGGDLPTEKEYLAILTSAKLRSGATTVSQGK